uniref:Potassium voltage-gated channel subfamily KQT member 1 n=1 Tax=Trichuris muris TaxID=70415 RepID=A0A5S6Q807_TRIMR
MTRQGRVFTFLERPTGWKCHVYYFTVFFIILAAFFLTVWPHKMKGHVLFYVELAITIILVCEYALRVWSAGCRFKYASLAKRLRFVRKPICLIELFVIVVSVALLAKCAGELKLSLAMIRGFQFLHIFQLLRIDRHYGSWRLLGSVVYMHRNELVTTIYISVLGLIFGSYFMFLAEKDVAVPENQLPIRTYADAMWWGVATFFTIGFGDMVPHSWIGKAVACISALALVAFFQLPAGILGSGFALKVHQKHRQKHFNRQVPAAASLIQALWQCYATLPNSHCTATWNKFSRAYRLLPMNKPPTGEEPLIPLEVNKIKKDKHLKNIIHAICKMKYLATRRKFQKLRELYDVRDIIEQYSQGHLNMMLKIKGIQRKIEQYIGKPIQPDNSGQVMTVHSRLIQIENQASALHLKLEDCVRLFGEIGELLEIPNQRSHDDPPKSKSANELHP